MSETVNITKKVKVILSLFKHHAMKTYKGRGSEVPCIVGIGTTWR
jgi:hypothetical protein